MEEAHPTGSGSQLQPGMLSANAPLAGYPRLFNIEMDPHEDINVATFLWAYEPAHWRRMPVSITLAIVSAGCSAPITAVCAFGEENRNRGR